MTTTIATPHLTSGDFAFEADDDWAKIPEGSPISSPSPAQVITKLPDASIATAGLTWSLTTRLLTRNSNSVPSRLRTGRSWLSYIRA